MPRRASPTAAYSSTCVLRVERGERLQLYGVPFGISLHWPSTRLFYILAEYTRVYFIGGGFDSFVC